jgi:glutaredoxin
MKGFKDWFRPFWIILVLGVMLGLAVTPRPASAQTATPEKKVVIYLFWGNGCPHCARAKPYLESLPLKYPAVELRAYEVYYNEQNQLFFSRMMQKYGIKQGAVPTIFIGTSY